MPTYIFHADTETTGYTITLTATDELGCSDTDTETVNVFPAADFTLDLGTDSVCSPLVLTLPNIDGATSITWNFGDGTTSNEQAPSHTWENSSNELLSTIVSFEAQTADGCIGSAQATVHVKPQPVADIALMSDASGCAPFQAEFANNSVNADDYVWNFGDGQISEAMSDASSTQRTFEAGNDAPVNYTITLIAIDALGCADQASLTVTALPSPAFDLQLEVNESCSPLTLVMPSMPQAVSTAWDFGDGTMSNEATPLHSWYNMNDDLMTSHITFYGSNEFGCHGETQAEVFIKPQPLADFTMDTDQGCAPLDVVFSNLSLLADTFIWNYGDGHIAEFGHHSEHEYEFEGGSDLETYGISLTATHHLGCSDQKTDSIEVAPQVFAAMIGNLEGCAPFDGQFTYSGTAATLIQWDLGDETVSEGLQAATTYDVADGEEGIFTIALAAMSAYGCNDIIEYEVTVHPTPIAEIALNESAACAQTPVEIWTNFNFADSVSIALGDGEIAVDPEENTLLHSYTNDSAQTLQVELTIQSFTDFGCSASASVMHDVHPKVTASFITPDAMCTPASLIFENQSVNADAANFWDFGDGSQSEELNPTHVFNSSSSADSTYTVTLTAQSAFGCSDEVHAEVVVLGTPIPTLAIASLEGCYPVIVTFANASEGQTLTSWSYGNGETAFVNDSLHTKTFYNPGDELVAYTTLMTVSNDAGCSQQSTVSFDVAPHLNAAFDIVTAGCSPFAAEIINQSEGAAAYEWDFDNDSDPSFEANPNHIFSNTTSDDLTYAVSLIATSAYGCIDTLSVGVEVRPMPEAQFSVTPATQTYPNTMVAINNTSIASGSAVQYWSFGDGAEEATTQPVFHTYGTWGTYNITLLVDNGLCADAHTEIIQILSPNPVSEFTGSGAGCAPLLIAFENQSNHGAGYVWDFGDDYMTSEESPVHVYDQPGIYNVSLTVIGYEGQEHTTVQYGSIEVFPSATAAFVFSPAQVIAPDEPVEFLNLSDEDATEFLWTFGDGMISTEENPTHTYTDPGHYDVSLTANNVFNCPNTFFMEHAIEAIVGGYMEFPTAFTPPNGGQTDGTYDPMSYDNDVFHPHHMGITAYELVVFNKWGELIFRSTDANIGWDGYFQGQISRQDVYAWRATAQFSNGHKVTKAGDVTLIIQ